jgi:STE24 endopeptidase
MSHLAHELGHWYYLHPNKLLCVSQLHIFTILALFPAFLHAPPVLRSFDFPKSVAARPPTIIAFILFQVPFVYLFHAYESDGTAAR